MNEPSPHDRRLFENLFVLELANNHWGSLDRGLSMTKARVARTPASFSQPTHGAALSRRSPH